MCGLCGGVWWGGVVVWCGVGVLCCCVLCCVLCVCCVAWVLVSRFHGSGVSRVGVGFKVWFGPPFPGPPLDRPKFRSFFPSPAAKCVLFFPLWVSSRRILVVFEAPLWASHVELLGLAKPGPEGVATLLEGGGERGGVM